MQLTPKRATPLIVEYIKARITPMIKGSPGIGKSGIVHQIAERFNLLVIDLRLSQCDPTDLLGFPNTEGGRARYVPMETFPIEGDELPIKYGEDGKPLMENGKPVRYAGWLLFLDEFTSASLAVKAAAYKLILDRMVGLKRLHKNVAIATAGNKEDDNAIVEPMGTALQSRLGHLELVVDATEWREDWALSNGIDQRIMDYIKFKPGSVYTFKPDHTDDTYACPRTWEFANRLMHLVDSGSDLARAAFGGVLSEGVANEFLTFTKIYRDLPKPEELALTPESARVPDEPGTLWAITGSVANHMNANNCANLMKYVSRLPKEFQIVTLRETVRRHKPLLAHPAMRDWIAKSSIELWKEAA